MPQQSYDPRKKQRSLAESKKALEQRVGANVSQVKAPKGFGPDPRSRAAASGFQNKRTPSPFAGFKPGDTPPAHGPNIMNGQNIKAKLAYLRTRRDQLAANPVQYGTTPDGTALTQSGGKQQSKIDFLKQQLAERRKQQSQSAQNVDPGFYRKNKKR